MPSWAAVRRACCSARAVEGCITWACWGAAEDRGRSSPVWLTRPSSSWGAVYWPAAGHGVEHGAHLQGRGGQLPLAKGEVGQGPGVAQALEGGQLPGGGPQAPAELLGAAKAQVIGHGEDFLPAQHPGGVDEVAVAGVGQGALQVQLPVGRAVHTVELQPPGVEGAHAGEGQLPQALLQQGGRHRHLEHRARRVGGKGPVYQGGILPLGGLAQIQGGKVRHAGHRPDFAPPAPR